MKIVPVASAVEAEATVCERLASRIVPRMRNRRKTATVITAAGIDAEHRHAHPQAEVGIGGAEHDAEHDTDDDGLEGELRDAFGLCHRRIIA